jgi:hypothetical protein
MSIEQKREFWRARIGQSVQASNYRGANAAGTIVDVRGGIWGCGGDAVALILDVKEDWGMDYWPAGRCTPSAV